jgi:beta-galactosidase
MKKQSTILPRRDFLKSGSVGLAGLALIVDGLPVAGATRSISATQARRVLPLNHNWLFSEKPTPNSSSATFDDRHFERVTIPHTNKVLPWHGFDDKAYQFVSIYRRHFKLPSELNGQRVFVDFGGVMTAATVFINGQRLGEYRGGYTPFSFELTRHINWKGDNVLAVEVDSTERKDIPPFGGEIDYLTFGGIYRDVALRVVPAIFIENVFAKPVNVLKEDRRLDVRCFINRPNGNTGTAGVSPALSAKRENTSAPLKLTVELRDGDRVIASQSQDLPAVAAPHYDISLTSLGEHIELWRLDHTKQYQVVVKLSAEHFLDYFETRIGFREARFTPDGFFLNGKHVKLRGLNRHQTFPFVGQAMPARVQRNDARILRQELKCNIVRTSHYPQSPHFLDACDEYGLLVLEEIPGWQHVGDQAWKDLSVGYVEAMIRRDWNHPAIILWGVRVNESGDYHDFYTRTNALAHSLDDSRQTGGVRYKYDSEFLEDVFTMNDFQLPLRPANHPLYLNTEFIGHMYPTKRNDNIERITEHAMRHARVHNQLGSDKGYAGGIGWCAFDYNTHANFCSGDRICYHGVSDIFRIPKPAAGVYKSQCDPKEEIVLEPAFDWSRGDRNESFNVAMICSNCEHLKVYVGNRLVADIDPDRQTFPNLAHPPFVTNIRKGIDGGWGDLKLEGYIGGKLVITKLLSGQGVDRELHVQADDLELLGDGIDATRVVLRVTDEYGGARPFANAAITMTIDGPGEIIGDNPFSLSGGVGAVWVKAKQAAGTIRLNAKHPFLGTRTIEIKVKPAPAEAV